MAERKVFELQRDGKTLELWEEASAVPEFFADGIHGISFSGSIVKFNFFTTDMGEEGNIERRHVVCRLVLGIDTFFSVAQYLTTMAEDVKKKMEIIETDAKAEIIETEAKAEEKGE